MTLRLADLVVGVVRTPWALDPDPTKARDWMVRELSRPEYRESWIHRFARWVEDLLNGIVDASGKAGSMNPFVAGLVILVLGGLLALALSRLRGTSAVRQQAGQVFTRVRRSAAEHRAAADAGLRAGEWDTAVVESVRALAAGLVERGLVPEQEDVTVHELIERASGLHPSLATRLRSTGVAFDETRYGDRPADEEHAREAVALEQEVSRRAPESRTSPSSVTAVPR